MSVATQRAGGGGGHVERSGGGGSSGLADVIELILDKGLALTSSCGYPLSGSRSSPSTHESW
jgi:hypothetical protein